MFPETIFILHEDKKCQKQLKSGKNFIFSQSFATLSPNPGNKVQNLNDQTFTTENQVLNGPEPK